MKMYIKYMASLRCIMIVRSILDSIGIEYKSVVVGEIEFTNSFLRLDQYLKLITCLELRGYEVVVDKKRILVERIKLAIGELIRAQEAYPKANFSNYLANRLNYDYTYLANIFSEVTGITVEYYVQCHNVERIKELLADEELHLAEISYKLEYSSVALLSSQFKKVTGLTPSFYRQIMRIRIEKKIEVWNKTSLN